uniref:Uncharacterized protein n=1 Tax=Odontella aurita TaxID=265563 RepID=A0A7S4HQ27_9STRA|mmetsp:Transcript_13474/g.39344  ORF Transcript_13474/g.39344 Transcript_13474/m.39344 type:complete len:510 (+) Transcript_13474:167-1696(+)
MLASHNDTSTFRALDNIMSNGGLTCGFACVILENANFVPFKSGPFCDNLRDGFVYDQYFFRSDVERESLLSFCGKTCGAISSEVCGATNKNGNGPTFEWSPLLFKSVFRDCCDDYGQTSKCSFCRPDTVLENPQKLVTNDRTNFEATCAEFDTWFDLEYWSHRSGETLDNYGPTSGNPRTSCNKLRWSDPIWSPIREWEPTQEDCPCVTPAPSSPPSQSISPSGAPSHRPTASAAPSTSGEPTRILSTSPTVDPASLALSGSIRDAGSEECSPKPSGTFSSLGGLFTGFYVAVTYGSIFWVKSKNAGRPRWGLYEMVSEVAGQFVATVVAVGGIFICIDHESSDSMDTIMSMTSLLAVDGFELILTLITIPFVRPEDHLGDSFDQARWNQLSGCSMWSARFLIWAIGGGLPLIMLFFSMFEKGYPLPVMIPCCISLGLGMVVGFFGPCVLRNPKFTGGGARFIWVLVKNLVGVIPGLIIAIYERDWVALGWGAEVYIELSHFIGECIQG